MQQSITLSPINQREIVVKASKTYTYRLLNKSGRTIEKGTERAGTQTINIAKQPNGIYVMQIISEN